MAGKVVQVIQATVPIVSAQSHSAIKKRRVAGYARVSTEKEEQQNSYEAQMDYYTTYIQSNPEWIFVDVYSDVDASYGLYPKSPWIADFSAIRELYPARSQGALRCFHGALSSLEFFSSSIIFKTCIICSTSSLVLFLPSEIRIVPFACSLLRLMALSTCDISVLPLLQADPVAMQIPAKSMR